MKKKSDNYTKVLSAIMDALKATGSADSNPKIEKKAKKLAKEVVKIMSEEGKKKDNSGKKSVKKIIEKKSTSTKAAPSEKTIEKPAKTTAIKTVTPRRKTAIKSSK
jgi:hypothetical protein